MSRFLILFGFALMFALIHMEGNLNKYINTKYAYLSISAILLLSVLSLFEFARFYRREKEAEQKKTEHHQDHSDEHAHDYSHEHTHDHNHERAFDRLHALGHGHSHGNPTKWQRTLSYGILIVPILTGIFLPVQTLDSSFVKAKGFGFPQFEATADNPGQHQFLKPDTSVYYGTEGYAEVKNQDLTQFANLKEIKLTDQNFLKGLEVMYNFPGDFMGRTISFDGFAYQGDQVDPHHYFVFRFGFIHCAADSGVFGMLVAFPNDTSLHNDEWVHVSGKLTWELYQPFKQTIPVLRVEEWNNIEAPDDPYVYRNY